MAGLACNFELKKDAVPVAFRGSRPVAEPLLPLLKQELDLLERQDVVRKVSKPTACVQYLADMTTFSTPFGRYQYKRLTFGVSLAGDDYSCHVSEVLNDLEN